MAEIKITGTITDFLHNEGLSVRLGSIDLGWVNGWGQKQYDIRDALKEYMVEGTCNTVGPASWRRTSFTVKKDDEEYRVEYKTDSGD